MAVREISLDTETTGLDPRQGHRIVEIGCVEMINRVRTGEAFHVYINPERDMPQGAFEVHGLSAEFLSDKPLFKDVVDKFLDFIGDSKLVIHNAAFDMKFLNYELKVIRKKEIPMLRTIDTLDIARRKFPGAQANLDALCRRFNIDLSQRTKHGALLDAELLADMYVELMGGRQRNLGFDAEDKKASKTQSISAIKQEKPIRKMREFPLTPEEEDQHKLLLETLKDPLWTA